MPKPTDDGRPAGYDALPARFKHYISGLERKVQNYDELHREHAETRVELANYSGPSRYFADDARFVFHLPIDTVGAPRRGRARIEVTMDRRRGTGGIAVSSPDGRIVVLPEVSNEVCVKVGNH